VTVDFLTADLVHPFDESARRRLEAVADLSGYAGAAPPVGCADASIIAAAGLLDLLAPDEVEVVRAHERGHLELGHRPYLALLDAALPEPARGALAAWARVCELSADRAAAAALGGSDAVIRVLFRLAAVAPGANAAGGAFEVRVREIQAWTATPAFARLVRHAVARVGGRRGAALAFGDMAVVHPIARAWISTGGTGARNYDEFADDAEITEVIAANPESALAIEMPHRAPDSLGKDFAAALTDAVARLSRQRADGSYAPTENVVAAYRISEPGRLDDAAYGLFAMVDTAQISTSADEPGLVIRNEDVFLDKVRERVALERATHHLLSPVLLLQTVRADRLHAAIAAAVDAAGAPAVADVDHVGRGHAVWPFDGSSATAAELLHLAGAGELVVADGNHRSLAAQIGGLRRFLAVITTPASVSIAPYHRLITDSPVPVPDLLARLERVGGVVTPAGGRPGIPASQGRVCLYAGREAYEVRLPAAGLSGVDSMDHAIVESLVLRDGLGLDPGDKRVVYVGGDYPPSWLAGEVDAGRAELAILIAPVTVDQFVQVNLARAKMPRKSTWFTPKARAGLVLADLGAEG
jgi:uncharacterized protein (DUF1015 family)